MSTLMRVAFGGDEVARGAGGQGGGEEERRGVRGAAGGQEESWEVRELRGCRTNGGQGVCGTDLVTRWG